MRRRTNLARWVRKERIQQGRPTIHYALFGGLLGTGKRLWGWYAIFGDDPAQMETALQVLAEKDRLWIERGYKTLPYI